jgi:hypothetical protein
MASETNQGEAGGAAICVLTSRPLNGPRLGATQCSIPPGVIGYGAIALTCELPVYPYGFPARDKASRTALVGVLYMFQNQG